MSPLSPEPAGRTSVRNVGAPTDRTASPARRAIVSPMGRAGTVRIAEPTRPSLVTVAPAPRRPVWLLAAIADARSQDPAVTAEVEELVVGLYHREGASLVRLARLFVDDRDAAEDLVQEAFLRLARHAGRIHDAGRAPAYLRSIVLNLARDHNRRGLVSLRHRAAAGREIDVVDDVADLLARSEEHRRVLAEVRRLPVRQRDCITLRYFEELSNEAIGATLGISINSVKTHLRRGMENLGRALDGGDGR
jgi:RNA polymerase sigma factor (sigma-70 family)